MRKGDIVRLVGNVTVTTDRGVSRQYQAGHQFEVVSVVGSLAKVKDNTGCRLLIEVRHLERVLSAPTPADDPRTDDGDDPGGGPVGARVMPRRRGLTTEPAAA